MMETWEIVAYVLSAICSFALIITCIKVGEGDVSVSDLILTAVLSLVPFLNTGIILICALILLTGSKYDKRLF